MNKELLTLEEVSELLRLPRNRLVVLARKGELPAYRLLGRWRFEQKEIESWLENNRVKPSMGLVK